MTDAVEVRYESGQLLGNVKVGDSREEAFDRLGLSIRLGALLDNRNLGVRGTDEIQAEKGPYVFKYHPQQQQDYEQRADSQDGVDTLETGLDSLALNTTGSNESATPFPFVNRETECEQLADVLLANHVKWTKRVMTTGAISQDRLTLATSAQMFGSGKSTFGVRFLERLRSLRSTQERLKKVHGGAAVEWLLNLVYTGLDFRQLDPQLPFIESIRKSLAHALFRQVEGQLENGNSLSGVLNSRNPCKLRCAEIIGYFEKKADCCFFLHLDEVSSLGPFLTTANTSEEVMLLYRMWTEISAIHNSTQSEVFCSGRSPSLFLLGKGFFLSQRDLLSPEDAKCILLDPLKAANLKEIFEVWLVPDDEFISKLHYITSGVPRFVAHAVDFFTDRIAIADADPIDYAARRKAFIQDSGPFVEYLNSAASAEMNPFKTMQREKRKFYVELIRVAALCLPLCLEKTIDGKLWGFESDVLTLAVCSAFPLYLKRFNPEYHFLVIPPVILDQIAKESPDSRLPFWSSMYNVHPVQAQALSSGDVLEIVIQHILRLRISEELHDGARPLCECLPFLHGSKIENNTFTYVDFKKFPKITKTPHSGKSVAILKRFFDNPKTAGFTDVHPDDLGRVLTLLEKKFFYVPLPKSSSCDLLFVTDQDVIVEMQFKNGKQEVSSAMMAKELEKSCCSHCYKNVVFVMVALTTPKEKLPNGTNVTNLEGDIIAVRYGENTRFDTFDVPSNLEVIVLLVPGLVSFLTQTNVDILRKSELDLNDMVLATRSPSKKKNCR